MIHKLLLPLLILATVAVAQTKPVAAPTTTPQFNHSFQGASFSVDVDGTWPTTYQWFRGAPSTLSTPTKIPAPEGIQPTLMLKPTDTAGLYYCVATNAAGSTMSGMFRLSFTTQRDAADMQVVIKKP